MTGYAAMGRVHAGPVHAGPVHALQSADGDDERAVQRPRPAGHTAPMATVVDPDAASSLAARWVHARRRLAETTFFLTDPNSWR